MQSFANPKRYIEALKDIALHMVYYQSATPSVYGEVNY